MEEEEEEEKNESLRTRTEMGRKKTKKCVDKRYKLRKEEIKMRTMRGKKHERSLKKI